MTKKWLKRTLLLLGAILSLVMIFNLFMDPFWCFEHQHKYNNIQKAINERQQKANYIYFTSKKFDALLIGSSRTTYMNRHAFETMQVFNFAAPAMRPQEYMTYIDFTINDANQPIKTIIIGFDFFGYLDYGLFMFNNAPNIVNATKSPFYRWKTLISMDATNNSLKNIRDVYHHRDIDRYNRDDVKSSFPRPTDLTGVSERIVNDAKHYAQSEYSSHPNPKFQAIVQQIKNKYNDKKFIIFTTPVSAPLFEQLIKTKHYEDYENWLRTLVNTYGTVHHFMYRNSISDNYQYYFADCNHAYEDTYTLVAHKITNIPDPTLPNDFGMELTKENIEVKLNELRRINGVE